MFTIALDARKRCIRIRAWGIWTEETFEHYLAEEAQAIAELGGSKGSYNILVVRADTFVLPAAVASALVTQLSESDNKAQRIAFVMESALARLQAKRLSMRQGMEVFDSLAKAEAWLDEAIPSANSA